MEDIYLQQYGDDWRTKIKQRVKEIAFIREQADEMGVEPETISQTLPPGIIKAREPGDKSVGGEAGEVPIQKAVDRFKRNGNGN
jgi:hypothetical protein